jgi:hypothetical protein
MVLQCTLVIISGYYPEQDEILPETYEEFQINSKTIYGRIVERITADQILYNASIDISPHNNNIVEVKTTFVRPTVKSGENLFKFMEIVES